MLPSLTALGHQAMCAAVLLSLQTVQSGRGWEVLWCLLHGHFSTSGATQRRWNRARLALHVISSMTASLPSLLPPGLWSTVLAKRAIPVLDCGVVG